MPSEHGGLPALGGSLHGGEGREVVGLEAVDRQTDYQTPWRGGTDTDSTDRQNKAPPK